MKKVLILPTNLDLNRGDQALVWEAVRLVDDIYGKNNVQCRIMASDQGIDSEVQKAQTQARGYTFIGQLLEHPGRYTKKHENDKDSYTLSTLIQWGGQAIIDFLSTFLLLSSSKIVRCIGKLFLNKRRKQILHMFEKADVIYVKGGGFIHSFGALTDAYFLYYLLFHIRLALALGKNVYVLPNSVGPLKNPIARWMTVKTLRKCKLVSVRENISLNYLKELNVNAKYYPDFGFYLQPSSYDYSDYLQKYGVPIHSPKVVITVRPNRFTGMHNAKTLYHNYLDGISELVKYLISNEYHVTFFAHTLGPSSHEDDRIAIHDVQSKLPKEVLSKTSYIEDFSLTCEDVEKIYSYYDYMIGTRFHSVIFSLNVGTPAIAIAYGGNKGKGIMEVLGNDKYSIDMDKIHQQDLVVLFKKLVEGKNEYLENLRDKRIIIDSMRDECINLIREKEEL